MELSAIHKHWENWAKTYNTDLRATTKTGTIKRLEIKSLFNAIIRTGLNEINGVEVLEAGCGNGYNCISLSQLLPGCSFTGIDYVPEMIDHAKQLTANTPHIDQSRLSFYTGNILDLENNENLKEGYDIILTDRCLINLNSHQLQLDGLKQLSLKLKKGGFLIILENILHLREEQNKLRTAVGLTPRELPEFNLFLDEKRLIFYLTQNSFRLINKSNFGSLHDIMLYVIVPMINDGVINYDHNVVEAVTKLCCSLPAEYENSFGEFGQNRLYLFEKL